MMQHHQLSQSLLVWSTKRASSTPDSGASAEKSSLIIALLCAAYAAEIGLKAILQRECKPAEGHHLGVMYGQLSPRAQTSILARAGYIQSELQCQLADMNTSCTALSWALKDDEVEAALGFLQRFAAAVQAEVEEGYRIDAALQML